MNVLIILPLHGIHAPWYFLVASLTILSRGAMKSYAHPCGVTGLITNLKFSLVAQVRSTAVFTVA
jgi:hypothetical protein